MKRIVSFLPSATELIYELGLQKSLVGVTHECNFPDDARNKPRVITTVIDSENLTSSEINQRTCELFSQGKDIFLLNETNLKIAEPDLIISQETCEVCAAYNNQVNKAIQILDKKPEIYSMNPHSLDEILMTVTELGRILEKEKKSNKIKEKLEKRISDIGNVPHKQKHKVLAIEWLDPFFTAGHWIPEMIEIAGGINLISKKKDQSRRLEFEEIVKSEPDIIILMPCGFDVKKTRKEYSDILKNNHEWNQLKAVKNNQIFAVDANSFFSKPSIRTITGLETLAKIIHPNEFSHLRVPKEAFSKI